MGRLWNAVAVLTSIATSHVGISHSFEDLQHDQTELNPSAKSGGGNSVSALGDRTQVDQDLDDHHTSWMIQLSLNLICYASIFVPGYYLRWRYLKRGGATQEDRGRWSTIERLCFIGRPDVGELLQDPELQTSARNRMQTYFSVWPRWRVMLFAFTGLLSTFLIWGYYQEKIMTLSYSGDKFTDSQFLVFMNRITAFLLSGSYLLVTHRKQPPHRAPFYKYTFASFSNTMSSWFQYEALKYVSFPTQILAKASKIIPVMLMGKVVNSKTYAIYEYVTAGVISSGMCLFLYSRWRSPETAMTLMSTTAGVAVLFGYMFFDSFTSNWQDKLFREYKMTNMQMMFGMSTCSMVLTIVSLAEQGGFASGFNFGIQHPEFVGDVLVFSLSQAIGTIFIYLTIQEFGAVVFAMVMTARQAIAVLLSNYKYGHSVSALGFLGVTLVFSALAFQAFARTRRAKVLKDDVIKIQR